MSGRALLAVALLALCGTLPDPCRAIDLAEIEALARSGKAEEALRRLERGLANQPDQLAGQFLRGVLLADLQRTGDAMRAFRLLSQQHPDRPEPVNNLAVLQAVSGRHVTAIVALEEIVTHYPTYETAANNLARIRQMTAAGDIEPPSPDAERPQLALTPRLGSFLRIDPSPPTPPAAAAAKPGNRRAEGLLTAAPEQPAAPEQAAPAAPRPLPSPEAEAEPVTAIDEMASAPAEQASSAEADRASPQESAVPSRGSELARVVEAWATAWSQQRVKEYLALYAADFEPIGYPSREAWETVRRQRVAAPTFIEVEIDFETMVLLETGDGEVSVTFVQRYRSDRFGDTVRKTLELVREDGAWRIRRETSS